VYAAGNDILLYVSICCKLLATKGLLEGSKMVDITGYEIGNVGKAVQTQLQRSNQSQVRLAA
jgi:hypothetical protein